MWGLSASATSAAFSGFAMVSSLSVLKNPDVRGLSIPIYNWPTLAITPAPRSPHFESQRDKLARLAEAIVCVSRPIFAWFFQLNENFAVGGSPQLCEPSISLDFRQISIGAPAFLPSGSAKVRCAGWSSSTPYSRAIESLVVAARFPAAVDNRQERNAHIQRLHDRIVNSRAHTANSPA
jgi:hypothetical protein